MTLLLREIRSILVLTKHRFMGDTIVAIPLLRATRRAYPNARITLVTGTEAATVLENCPYNIRILAHDKKAQARTAAGSAHLSTLLARQMVSLFWNDRPDLCLVADRSFRAATAALLAGGRVRAGFDSEGRGCLLTHPIPYSLDRHEAECCLDILRAVTPEGAGEPRYDPVSELWLTEAERTRGREILEKAGASVPLAIGVPLVGFQPGASHDYKAWPPERFAAVARALAIQQGAGIVLLGYGTREEEAAMRMKASIETGGGASSIPVFDLTSKTKLRETMGVLSHLSLFLGNDTGVNHIAASLGVATVALFGPTPAHKWGNTGPRGRVLVAPDGKMDRLEIAPVREAAQSLLTLVVAEKPIPVEAERNEPFALGTTRR